MKGIIEMKTATRVYDSFVHASAVVRKLNVVGIPDDDISMIANRGATTDHEVGDTATGAAPGVGLGATVGGGAGLLAGLGLLAIPGLGPVVAAGWLASLLVGAGVGAAAGGVVGTLVEHGVSAEDAEVYSEAVRRGGTMVNVRYNEAMEDEVMAALDSESAMDTTSRRGEYETSGWKGFDPAAPDYVGELPAGNRTRRVG